jgi:hypothetical protein
MAWSWTDEDRHTAEKFRLARLREQVPQLRRSLLHLDLEYVLHVYTYDPVDAAALTLFADEFQQQVYLILGCRQVSVWLENELAYARVIDLQSALTLAIFDEEDTLMIATAERPTETASPNAASVAPVNPTLPGQTLAAIAEDTEQPLESIQAWIAEHGWPIIPFNGELIISGDAAIAALNHFSEVLKQQRLAKRGLLQTPVNMEMNGSTPEPEPIILPEPTASQPKAKSTARSTARAAQPKETRPALTLPAGYANKIIKGQTRTNFERALPVNPDLRAKYLEAIANETDDGKLFVDRVVSAIVRKFKGNKDKLTANVMQLAKKMQAEPAS